MSLSERYMKTIYVVRGKSYSLSAVPEGDWLVAAYEFAEQADEHVKRLSAECTDYMIQECGTGGGWLEWNDRAAENWNNVSKYDAIDSVLYEGGNEYWVEEVELLQEVK